MENETTEIPEKETFESLHKITPLSKYLALLLFIILPFAGGWIGYKYAPTKEVVIEKTVYIETQPLTDDTANSAPSLNMNNQPIRNELNQSATSSIETFHSKNLGIKFTYNPIVYPGTNDPSRRVAVLEDGNLISLYIPESGTSSAKTIEVFAKDPNSTIKEAIEESFLISYKPEDCFVIPYEGTTIPGYQHAMISYPESSNPNAPFWENIDKCPGKYSRVNAVRHFIFNPAVPNKYIFVDLGQDGLTTDGISNKVWSSSIQIMD